MTGPRLRVSRRSLAGAVAFIVSGCSRLFVAPPPKYIFRLQPARCFPPDLPHLQAQLLVASPSVPASLDQRRIALTKSPLSLDYFADAEWADAVSMLVQDVLTNSFENSRAITVVNSGLGLLPDFFLTTEVRHFEAEYGPAGGPPSAWVSIDAKLVAMPQREVVAQSLFERRAPASADDLPAIATAFDAALGAVATAIVTWTLADAAIRMRRHPL